MNKNSKPILLQTLWRTGGTYLAFRLRETHRLTMYIEPLHEDFSRFARHLWNQWAAEGMVKALGHPVKDFHYLTDYPVGNDGMVPGHQAALAWFPYVLSEDESAPDLGAYLNGLLASARDRAVFKFCRGALRSTWIARQLNGVTVYVMRDPAEMIASYLSREQGDYFFSAYLRILHLNATQPVLAPLHAFVTRRCPAFDRAYSREALQATTFCHFIPMSLRIAVAQYYWVLALANHCRSHSVVVDAACFGEQATMSALSEALGLEVDLSDAEALPARGGVALDFNDPEWRAATEAGLAALGAIGPLPESASRVADLVDGLLC